MSYLKKSLLLVFISITFLSLTTSGQADSTLLKEKFYRVQQQSLFMLSGWSVLNIGISPLISSNLRNPTNQIDHFHRTNFYWNFLNLGIAGFSHYSVLKKSQENWTVSELATQKQKAQKAISVNMGLDLLYVLGGYALKYASNRNENLDAAAYHGNGNSLILQGGYLFLYDAIFVLRLNKIKFR